MRFQRPFFFVFGLIFLSLTLLGLSNPGSTLQLGVERISTPHQVLGGTLAAIEAANNTLATQLTAVTPTPPQAETENGKTPWSPATLAPSATPTPTPPLAHFSNLRFTTQPETNEDRRFYAAGTPRIFAVWEYQGMDESMLVRREWRRNGELWVVKEVSWEMEEYGSDGTVRNVLVFDETAGLSAGEYSLTLYINGEEQKFGDPALGDNPDTFWIFPSSVPAPTSSPDLAYTAIVSLAGRLTIEYPTGELRDLVVTEEISGIAWFPDNLHLIYEERDRSRQISAVEDWGVTHKLWVLNIENGDRHLIGTTGENFHSPVVSPNGKYIAALAGETRREGCTATPVLVLLELDSELRRQAVYVLADFTGLPYSESTTFQAFPNDRHSAGWWEDEHTLAIPLSWTCLNPDDNPQAVYSLDLITKRAEKARDL